jgi:molecular chaperone DnaK
MGKMIGFDFGTTNCLISVIEGGRTINYLEGDLPHPSVVCYEADQVIAGRDAKQRLTDVSVGVVGNIVTSPKSLLDQDQVYVDGVQRRPREICADLIRHVHESAKEREPDEEFDTAIVTIPVGMQGLNREVLRDAFQSAGIQVVQFVHEPFAALYAYLRSKEDPLQALRDLRGNLMLVFDWGGGTLDLTLCQLQGDRLVEIRNFGTPEIGGDHIDVIIRNFVLDEESRKRSTPAKDQMQIGAKERLLAACEKAKIQLSEEGEMNAIIYVSDAFDDQGEPDIEYELTRDQLEQLAADAINKGVGAIQTLLESIGIDIRLVSLCLATGGMINMPAIRSRLRELFGPQRLELSAHGETIIAEGAAWIANDRPKLMLAKPLEVLVNFDSYFPLIKEGTVMPSHGHSITDTLNMFVTDPRDGAAKIQLTSPVRPGKPMAASRRSILDIMSIAVDQKARKLFERLEMEIQVDQNLVAHITAASTSHVQDRDSISIHDLEFSLSLGGFAASNGNAGDVGPNGDDCSTEAVEIPEEHIPMPSGSITLRTNIARNRDKKFVPGDYLYAKEGLEVGRKGAPLNTRQHDEFAYYQPCSVCGRTQNHPSCHCESSL